jgi:hypothetical protein
MINGTLLQQVTQNCDINVECDHVMDIRTRFPCCILQMFVINSNVRKGRKDTTCSGVFVFVPYTRRT